MANKNKTVLIVGGLALAGIIVYMMTKKPATTTTATTPVPPNPVTSTPNPVGSLVNAGTTLLGSLLKGLGTSTPAAPATTPVLSAAGTPANPDGGIDISGGGYSNPQSNPDVLGGYGDYQSFSV